MNLLIPLRPLALWALAVAVAGAPARAEDDPATFYAGRSVRLIVGAAVGSAADTTARILARRLGEHIPGKPQVTVNNQPGARSLTMTAGLYANGPRDGSVLALGSPEMPSAPLLSPEAARFDPTRLGWIGSTHRETQVTYAWSTVPVRTIEDIRTKKFVVGSQAPGSSQNDFPMALNNLFGMRFSVVNGYESISRIHQAMERGEVHGVGALSWTALAGLRPQWIAERKINLVAQFALRPSPALAGVPMWLDVARTEEDRQAMQLLLARLETARPFFMPPDVPPARLEAVRRAFDATMKDAAFLAEAAQARLEISPSRGEELAAFVAGLAATPPAVVQRVREALAVR